MAVSVNVQGVEEFQTAMHTFDAKMQQAVSVFLQSWITDVQERATRKVPVRTGYLRSTIYAKVHEWHAELGAEAAYAAFVEFGTRFRAAQPYLLPAIQEHLPQLTQVINEAIEMAKREAGL